MIKISHKFSVKDIKKLDNPGRREIMPPKETLEKLHLQTGDIVADVGCGIGYFSIPAALIVGEMGEVYAMDISNEMLQVVQEKVNNENIANIKTIQTVENGFMVDDESITYVFICNVLHETENISNFLAEVNRVLAAKGKVAIIEWMKKDSLIGPPISERIEKNKLLCMLTNINFTVIEIIDIGNEFYGIVVVKQ